MLFRAVIFSLILFFFAGCIYEAEPMPQVMADRAGAVMSQQARAKPANSAGIGKSFPKGWLPPAKLEHKWTAIIIHHSGTATGNAAIFDKWHREDNHWEGVGYDFVIGNGTDSGEGKVEVTFRWRYQMAGAHCGGTKGNWANKYAVGICLVGDFDEGRPSRRQAQSLVRLVRFLQGRYGIATSRIYGHNTTPGARVTNCPGMNFSIAKFRAMLGN